MNYTVEEVARQWKCSERTVYDLLRAKRLQGFRIGRSWRVTEAALEAYVSGDTGPVRKPPRKNIQYIH